MRGVRNVKVRIPLTEQLIRFFLCQSLKRARGYLYTIKPRVICAEILRGEDRVSQSCRMAVRWFLQSALKEAVVHDLSTKYRIVVQVHKARELLGCAEYED